MLIHIVILILIFILIILILITACLGPVPKEIVAPPTLGFQRSVVLMAPLQSIHVR